MNDGDTRTQTEVAVFAFLERGFEDLELSPTADQLLALSQLIGLLEQWSPKINLTGHRDPLQMAGALILDAAALSDSVPEIRSATSVSDLGTGAGFPGLPLAILHPEVTFYLVDSRKKRNHFQREVRRRLALSNVEPLLGRSDQIEPKASRLVIAQAMAQPDQALRLMTQWAGEGAPLVLPASEAAVPPDPPEGFAPPVLRTYRVPLTGTERRVWVVTPNV